MRNTKANIVIITLMLVTFFGQALASVTMSCNHDMPMKLAMMDHDNMSGNVDHASIILESNEQTKSRSVVMDCCQKQCKCPITACISPYIFLETRLNTFSVEVIADKKIAQLPLMHQPQINTSLYRPPIS